jgi:hypothetical protein
MMPVADDEIAPKPAAPTVAAATPKPKVPVKKATPKPATPPATATATASTGLIKPAAKKITSNGETLIGTINGIPVISDSKSKSKPEAAADGLRGRSL